MGRGEKYDGWACRNVICICIWKREKQNTDAYKETENGDARWCERERDEGQMQRRKKRGILPNPRDLVQPFSYAHPPLNSNHHITSNRVASHHNTTHPHPSPPPEPPEEGKPDISSGEKTNPEREARCNAICRG